MSRQETRIIELVQLYTHRLLYWTINAAIGHTPTFLFNLKIGHVILHLHCSYLPKINFYQTYQSNSDIPSMNLERNGGTRKKGKKMLIQ